MTLDDYENEVGELDPLENRIMDFKPEQDALKSNGYEAHRGLRPGCNHWRKSKDKGCFHITMHKSGVNRIHWDRWDPRHHPIRHFWELIRAGYSFPRMFKTSINSWLDKRRKTE